MSFSRDPSFNRLVRTVQKTVEGGMGDYVVEHRGNDGETGTTLVEGVNDAYEARVKYVAEAPRDQRVISVSRVDETARRKGPPKSRRVDVNVARRGDHVQVTVGNHGVNFSPDDLKIIKALGSQRRSITLHNKDKVYVQRKGDVVQMSHNSAWHGTKDVKISDLVEAVEDLTHDMGPLTESAFDRQAETATDRLIALVRKSTAGGSANVTGGDKFVDEVVRRAQRLIDINKKTKGIQVTVDGQKIEWEMVGEESLDEAQGYKTESLVRATRHAYSFDRYGEKEWTGIAKFLLSKGLSERQAAVIMISKHMRWSGDNGGETLAAFKKYYDGKSHPSQKGKSPFTSKEVADLLKHGHDDIIDNDDWEMLSENRIDEMKSVSYDKANEGNIGSLREDRAGYYEFPHHMDPEEIARIERRYGVQVDSDDFHKGPHGGMNYRVMGGKRKIRDMIDGEMLENRIDAGENVERIDEESDERVDESVDLNAMNEVVYAFENKIHAYANMLKRGSHPKKLAAAAQKAHDAVNGFRQELFIHR